jgi:YD repeat-containing protein
VHLHYDNPLGRLTDIKRVVNNQAVETLTQYRYDEHGQLTTVINRNGEHYHFRYDLDARTSWATDVLGRELEVQYNADHRVIASRGMAAPGGRVTTTRATCSQSSMPSGR